MTTDKQETIPLFTVFMSPNVDKPLLQTLHSGYIGQGSKVEEFEKALGGYIGNKNVLTLNSATSALHLSLRLAGVGQGDEVITTAMTCTATNMPILANGASIVWADVDPQTALIDPLDVERKITEKTKAIIAVDWGGAPVDLGQLMQIGKKYHLKVIEDAAHAFGATYNGVRVGNIADYTCFSFQAIKHVTTVDGGALFCKDTEDYKKGKLLRWYGIDREGERKDFRCEEDIKDWGYKFHMNDINATIGLSQLPHADEILEKHRANGRFYMDNLNSRFYEFATRYDYSFESSFWLFTMLLPDEHTRLEFMRYMGENGVMVSQVHARNDLHTTFKPFKVNLPGVEEFTQRQVSIPVHWNVTETQRAKIVKLANEFAAKYE